MKSRVNLIADSGEETLPWANLASILQELFPVKFTFQGRQTPQQAAGIIISGLTSHVKQDGLSGLHSLRLPRTDGSAGDGAFVDISVRFSSERDVPFPFQGRHLRTKVAAAPEILTLRDNERALATTDDKPVWAVSECDGVKHFRSGFRLPAIPREGSFLDVLKGDRFLEMVPLLHWLRHICATTEYHGPPLRATFVFDDPNLHWPRYGFIDFKQVAAHAERENYHVSCATIPLDTWFTHRATSEVFRTNPSRLSLAIHGNNHIKKELLRTYTHAERISLLRQAIRRIERLERSSGVPVSRVMVPPHGACSEEMLAELPKCGFEAACISHGSLRAHNRHKGWTRDLGYLPSESLHGCPVIPRWAFAANTQNTILLAAYLRQAIVLRGHHQDLKDGIELLDELARFINGLGAVTWSNLTNLSRGNYSWRLNGDTFVLKPLSVKLNVLLPGEAKRLLLLEDPAQGAGKRWRIENDGDVISGTSLSDDISLPTGTARTLLIERVIEHSLTVVNDSKLWSNPWPCVRRLLTEARDRLPFLSQ